MTTDSPTQHSDNHHAAPEQDRDQQALLSTLEGLLFVASAPVEAAHLARALDLPVESVVASLYVEPLV